MNKNKTPHVTRLKKKLLKGHEYKNLAYQAKMTSETLDELTKIRAEVLDWVDIDNDSYTHLSPDTVREFKKICAVLGSPPITMFNQAINDAEMVRGLIKQNKDTAITNFNEMFLETAPIADTPPLETQELGAETTSAAD